MERWAERAGLDPEGLGTQDNNEDLGVVACLILSRQSVGSVSQPGSYTDDSPQPLPQHALHAER